MIHAIFFTSQFRFIMTESQGVGGDINLRNDLYIALFSQFLQVDEFFFRIVSVPCRQSRISITFQAEGGIRF